MADGSDDYERPPPATATINAPRPSDCIKILLATDNHIGYAERDPVRGKDSINTFREILELAVENEVDMLLLAGDLFHENKPSRASLYQVIALLRQYCMGPRPIALQIVSDAGMGLGTNYDFPQINYEDENLNVGLPVFSIHGNHDDPQGAGTEGALCALDILSASGLINYFGRQELPGSAVDDDEAREQGIQVKPLLLQKGQTCLALYGVGNMRDERFYAEMRKGRISLFKPTERPEAWFNLLLIHQNRATHNPKSSVPEDGFGDDVDLIVWGHEHDCRIVPEQIAGKNYRITQPGSSIATSLAEGESKPKMVALLQIQDRDYMLHPIPLRSVRPFVIDEINLNEEQEVNNVELGTRVQVTKFLKGKVNDMITKAKEEWKTLHPDQDESEMMLPLIRLRVTYEGSFETGNPQRFGQEFAKQVANPKDVIAFVRRKRSEARKKIAIDQPEGVMDVDDEDDDGIPAVSRVKVETLVHEYLSAQQLEILAENGMSRAVDNYVEKDDSNAIKDFIKRQLAERRVTLKGEKKLDMADDAERDSEDELAEAIARAKLAAVQHIEVHGIDGKGKGKAAAKGKGKAAAAADEEDSEDSFGQMSDDAPPAKSKAKTPAKGKGKAVQENLFRDSEEDDDSDDPPPAKKPVAKKATTTAAKKAPAKKPTAKETKQSQLTFAPPARGARAAAAKSTKASKSMAVDLSSDEDDADAFEDDDDDDDGPARKRSKR